MLGKKVPMRWWAELFWLDLSLAQNESGSQADDSLYRLICQKMLSFAGLPICSKIHSMCSVFMR